MLTLSRHERRQLRQAAAMLAIGALVLACLMLAAAWLFLHDYVLALCINQACPAWLKLP